MAVVAVGATPAQADGGAGSLLAWGLNNVGQLGDNAAEPQANVPVMVSAGAIPAGTTITQIAAGKDFSLALSSTGQIYAWGSNLHGQLGDNAAEAQANVPVAVSPGAIPAGTTITQIAAGEFHSLALSSSGQLYAWGNNAEGELGDNNAPTQANVPVAVASGAIPLGTTFTQIAAGRGFSLALSSRGQTYGWGDNSFGQLGDNAAELHAKVPVAVSAGAIPIGTTITTIAAGGLHSLAVNSSGQLYAWGRNGNGQLGDNAAGVDAHVPVAVSAGAIPIGTTITQIAAAGFHSLALSSSGQVYSWGRNAEGQLGNTPTGAPMQAHVPVAVSLALGTTIDAISRGPAATHSLALIGDLAVTTATAPEATVGVPYTAAMSAIGGVGGDRWIASGLPGGLSINSSTGVISGTATNSGLSTIGVSVSDENGLTATRILALNVKAGPLTPISPVSPVTPNSAFTTLSVTVNRKTGAITFVEAVGDPGTLSVTLAFPNGKFGVFAVARAKCTRGHIVLKGRCRAAMVRFGAGRKMVGVPGTFRFTVSPNASAFRALKTALKHRQGLRVAAVLTYQSARGGAPVSHTRSIVDKLAKALKK